MPRYLVSLHFAQPLILSLALCATPLLAQGENGPAQSEIGPAQSETLMSRAAQPDLPAAGLLFYGASPQGAVCTGTLVAPDLVLTAAHCVDEASSSPGKGLVFAAGWHQGTALARRSATDVIFAGKPSGADRGLEHDLALIVLDAPIPSTKAAPVPMGMVDGLSQIFSMTSYRRSAPDVITRTDDCHLLATQGRILSLDCPVVSGNSGAPVLMQKDGVWQVVAVMVAQAQGGGPVQSYAVIPGDDLRRRIAGH